MSGTLKSPHKGTRKSAKPEPARRTRFLKVRCTEDEYKQVRQRAGQAQMTLSDYLRHAAFHQRIVAKDAGSVIGELRRIGALIKHNYPRVLHWSDAEKRRYWKTHEQLWALADQLAHKIGLQKKPPTP